MTGEGAVGESEGIRYATGPGRWVLTATVLGSGMAGLDATVVNVALPTIGREYDVGVAGLQWVVNAYTLTLAGLLLLGGTLGDRYGRRRLFILGTVWFALASLACALAPNAITLIFARGLQGIGGALLTPGSLAILQSVFVSADRSKAIGAWSGLGGVASAIGPFLGGWLIEAVSWRLIFLINLPLAAAAVLIAIRHVPQPPVQRSRQRLDIVGALSITAGLIGVTYGLISGPNDGWLSPLVVLSLGAGVALLVVFLVWERHATNPMLPLGIFRSVQFSAANAVTFVVYAALGGGLFLLPIVLQQAVGYSPLFAGVALLPITVIMLALSGRSGALADRIGPRLQMSLGPIVIAAGLALLVRIDGSGDYLTQVLPAILVFGLGLAINVAPLTSTALAAAPAEHAGIASGVNNGVARTAGLLAVAVLPVAAGITGDAYLHPSALLEGFRSAVLIAAGLCVAGGVLAAITIRNPSRGAPGPASHELHCALEAPPLRRR
ncbi:DHA2 family efflux MFS transporter permease subunit [Saxibacter everestensis]|uniref:DHA2 family efflux MFS transporter permease subunit n=1 Tax=Saxibacter everestensis TaxID=2909229 RepID=A0ABY8QS04_9MICO|nr:DHA2 family efflux MFS transporter permease subunit [Brevibacteriaceae bacterium ZFBP1038]